jgi:hypothetical protein
MRATKLRTTNPTPFQTHFYPHVRRLEAGLGQFPAEPYTSPAGRGKCEWVVLTHTANHTPAPRRRSMLVAVLSALSKSSLRISNRFCSEASNIRAVAMLSKDCTGSPVRF